MKYKLIMSFKIREIKTTTIVLIDTNNSSQANYGYKHVRVDVIINKVFDRSNIPLIPIDFTHS